jgi:hypothetical protein
MSVDYLLTSNIPIAVFFEDVVPRTKFREATAGEIAERDAERLATSAREDTNTVERLMAEYKLDLHTATVASEVIKRQGQITGCRVLVARHAPAEQFFVYGGGNGITIGLGPVYRLSDLQQAELKEMIETIRAAGFSAEVFDEYEPQYWGYNKPEEIAAWRRHELGPEGWEDGKIVCTWSKASGAMNAS